MSLLEFSRGKRKKAKKRRSRLRVDAILWLCVCAPQPAHSTLDGKICALEITWPILGQLRERTG